jgi:hypothetical protein
MDRITHCPKCGKRMVPVVTISGRTDFQCIGCDDPAAKWAESSLSAPEKPIVRPPRAEARGSRRASSGGHLPHPSIRF